MKHRPIERALIIVMALAPGHTAAAQSSQIDWQIPSILALDAGSLPDAFTSRCGRGLTGLPGWGAYVALAAQRGSIGLQADTRAIIQSEPGGCPLDEPIVQVGENLYERRPGWRFSENIPRGTLVASTLRAVLDFGPSVLRTSAKVGGGFVWGKREVPVAVGSLSTRFGRGPIALYLEFEMMQSWINATQEVERFRVDSTGHVSLGRRTVSTQLKPRWFALRAGMALGRRSKKPR